jgi:hypothetical protein
MIYWKSTIFSGMAMSGNRLRKSKGERIQEGLMDVNGRLPECAGKTDFAFEFSRDCLWIRGPQSDPICYPLTPLDIVRIIHCDYKGILMKANKLMEIRKIFNDKHWPLEQPSWVDSCFIDIPSQRFTKFCESIDLLDNDEADLIIELTQHFNKFDLGSYEGLLIDTFKNINPSVLKYSNVVYCYPLISPEDIGKTKSGPWAIYGLRSVISAILPDKEVHFVDSGNSFPKASTKRLIFLLDDFIGSGETASSAYKYFIDSYQNEIQGDLIVVLSLVAHSDGIYRLHSECIPCFFGHSATKGITNNPSIFNKRESLDIMDKIERKLRVNNKYKRGYAKSEALISMINTPNNTFPVFWAENKYKNRKWPAPFPRMHYEHK